MMDIMPKYLLSFQAAIMLKVNAAVSSVKKKCFSSFKGSYQIFCFVKTTSCILVLSFLRAVLSYL